MGEAREASVRFGGLGAKSHNLTGAGLPEKFTQTRCIFGCNCVGQVPQNLVDKFRSLVHTGELSWVGGMEGNDTFNSESA